MANNIIEISKVPGGIDILVTLTFLAGAEITTAIGGTATAWVEAADGTKTAATTATVVSATSLRFKWPFDTLPEGIYDLEAYLAAPAGDPVRVGKFRVLVSDYLG